MALPRYERRLGLPSIPRVDPVGAREASRTQQVLAQNMDRLSQFAFRKAGEQAEIRGQEYGAANAPTPQQLMDAKARGEDIEGMIPGDSVTIFGQAARKQVLASLTSNMQTQALGSLRELQQRFDRGEITAADMSVEFNDMIDGYAAPLLEISPIAAQKFRASFAVHGNAALLSAQKDEIKALRAQDEIAVRFGIDQLIESAEYIVRAGNTVDPEGNVVTVNDRYQVALSELADYASQLEDPELYETKAQELEQAFSEAKVGVVMDEAITNPAMAMAVFNGRGTFTDPEVQTTFDMMDNQERRELFTQLVAARSTQLSLESAEHTANERRVAERVEELQAQIREGMFSGDTIGVQQTLTELRNLDPSAWAASAAVVDTTVGYDNPDSIAILTRDATANRLTAESIDAHFRMGFLDIGTYQSFYAKLDAQRDSNYREAITTLRLSVGLPDIPLVDGTATQRRADKQVGRIQTALIAARRENPAIDPYAFVQNEIANNEELQNAQRMVDAERVLDELRAYLDDESLSAGKALEMLQNQPSLYPNEARRNAAIQNLQLLIGR